jgi:3-hydroxymyristoyl/3-hydroxydecanoyl-(acyl carrier protein) dehydratase
MNHQAIVSLMPQQPPFLFIDEAVLGPNGASGSYRIQGNETVLQGHFKNNPVFPASISLEALGQLGVLFLLAGSHEKLKRPVDPATIYFTGCDGVRSRRICRPGDVLEMQVELQRLRHPLATFSGSIQVAGQKAAVADEITLLFDYRK